MKKHLWIINTHVLAAALPLAVIASCSNQNENQNNNNNNNAATLDPAGGQIANNQLLVSAYKSLVEQLQLSAKTDLRTLNDQTLNVTLHQQSAYANLTLKIENNSNTKTGQLLLDLSGQFGQQSVNNAKIEITGFATVSPQIQLQFSNFKIDYDKWVSKLLPIISSSSLDAINGITNEQWKDLLTDFVVKDANGSLIGSYQELLNQNYQFDFQAKVNQQQIEFNIKTTYQNAIYENGKWISDPDLVSLEQILPNTTLSPIATIDEVKSFLINQSTLNETVLKQLTPSYFLANDLLNQEQNNPFWTIVDLFSNSYLDNADFKKAYFKPNTQLSVQILTGSVQEIKDWENELSLIAVLVIDNDLEQNFQKPFSRIKNQTKAIGQLNLAAENRLVIKQDATIFEQILKLSKSAEHVDQFQRMFNGNPGTTSQIEALKTNQIIAPNLQNLLQDLPVNPQLVAKWTQLEKEIEPQIFNLPITLTTTATISPAPQTINVNHKLFWFDNTTAFMIDKIQFVVQPELDLSLETLSPYLIQLSFKAQTIIDFANQEQRAFATTFEVEFPKDRFDAAQPN